MFLNVCGLWKKTNAKNENARNDLSGTIDSPVDLVIRAGHPVVIYCRYIPPGERTDNSPMYQVSIAPQTGKKGIDHGNTTPPAAGDDIPF